MTELELKDLEGIKKTERLKTYKLVQMIQRDTESEKLIWKNSYKDKDSAIFIAMVDLTPKKQLMFTLRCTEESEIKEDNILRVTFRVKSKRNESQSVQAIKSVSLIEYPLMIVLIRKLCKNFLNKEFISPFAEKETAASKEKSHETIIATNIEMYRKHILTSIKDIMKSLPGNASDWETNFIDVFVAYDNAKKADTYEELNDLLFKASNSAKKLKPLKRPRIIQDNY